MRRSSAVLLLAASALALAPAASARPGVSQQRPERIVVFALPGVDWHDVLTARMPVLESVMVRGAVGGLVVRSATRGMTPARGYMTLGAGQRAFAQRTEHRADLAYPSGAWIENGTALQAAARRYGGSPDGAVVSLELGYLKQASRGPGYGAKLGAFGDALAAAGVRRAVVSAADLTPNAGKPSMRRSAVLGIVDSHGSVDAGRIDSLVSPDASAPFGMRTDLAAFTAAVEQALRLARVVLIDPGETQRADEFAALISRERARDVRRRALERADALLGAVTERLGPRDLLLVTAVSGPRESPTDVLTPMVASGPGFERGWLTSGLTRRNGLVMLTEVAPTIVTLAGGRVPAVMSDGTIRAVASADPRRARAMARLSDRSVLRDRFAIVPTALFVALLALVALGAFATFLIKGHPGTRLLASAAFAVLAIPVAATLVRAFGIDLAGIAASIGALLAITALLACVGLVCRRRWAGAVVLLLLGLVLMVTDLLNGAAWQLNGAFGYSPLLAGRFYGNGNLGFAILFASAILGLTGLADVTGRRRPPWWLPAALAAVVFLGGYPSFGADFGGVLAGVPAVAVTVLLGRGRKLRYRTVALALAAGVVLGVGAMLADLARPPESRTHLGVFAARVLANGPGAGLAIVERKIGANLGLLTSSVWVYAIPLGVAVLLLLLWRPPGVHSQAMRDHPLLRAGLFGSLTAGIVGFLVNDSGVAIPGMVLGLVVPFFVLIGLDAVRPRSLPPVRRRGPQPTPR